MVQDHRRRRPRRPTTALARWSGRAALVIGIVCLGLGVITPPAGADNARISAEARCDRVVSWVVQAAADTSGGKADSSSSADRVRTNDSIEVSYRPAASGAFGGSGDSDGAGDGKWTAVETSALNAANGFTFSGSFPLPESVDSVELRVQARTAWADGSKAGSPKYAVARVPEECTTMPAVAVITPTCEAGGAVVQMSNAGDKEMSLELNVDRVTVRTVEVAAGSGTELVVPILAGTPSVIRVNAGDFVVAQRKVDADCTNGEAAAVILERCPGNQAVVSALRGTESGGVGGGSGTTAGGSQAKSIEIRTAGTIVHKGDLSTDGVFRRTLELPGDGPVTVEVKIDGRTAAIGQVGSCEGPIAGAVSCGGLGQVACSVEPDETTIEAPPPPPPPLTIELDGNGLPVTGPWQRAVALLLGGALLSIGGVTVIADQRRRPRPSLLAASVDDYRRQWWT